MKRITIIQNGQQIGWEEIDTVKSRLRMTSSEQDSDIFSGLRSAIAFRNSSKNISPLNKELNYGKCDRSCCNEIIDKNKSLKSYQPFGMKGIELWFCSKECQDGWYANMQG